MRSTILCNLINCVEQTTSSSTIVLAKVFYKRK